MTLSESRIRWMWSEARNDTSDRMAYQVLAAMVEAEVRKEHEALVRQMLAALDDLVETGEEAWGEERPCVRIGKEEIAAARAWLNENGGQHGAE